MNAFAGNSSAGLVASGSRRQPSRPDGIIAIVQ
jgi:hypothetical protein